MNEKEIRKLIYGIADDSIGSAYGEDERARRNEYKKMAANKMREAGVTEDSIVANEHDARHMKGQIKRWMERF